MSHKFYFFKGRVAASQHWLLPTSSLAISKPTQRKRADPEGAAGLQSQHRLTALLSQLPGLHTAQPCQHYSQWTSGS